MLTIKMSTGVAPEVKRRVPPCPGNIGHRRGIHPGIVTGFPFGLENWQNEKAFTVREKSGKIT